MAIRVALIGTGNAGRIALRALIDNPAYELTGVWVSTAAKVGRDAGDLAGLDIRTGVAATDDLDAIIAAEPDAAVYCAMGDTRLPGALRDVCRLLAAGINVIGTAPGVLQYPWGVIPDKFIGPVEEAARQGGSSVYVNGVDPGFINDLVPLAFTSTCEYVEQIRCLEIADYATYDGAEVMFDVMGFGSSLDEVPMLLQPGILSIAWGAAIRELAAGLGVRLDAITDSCEREPAPEAFDIAAGHIPKGGVAALKFEIHGIVDGHPLIVVEHITRLRSDLRPDWAQPAQPGGSYRVEITGEPSYTVDIRPTSRRGDHNYSAIAAGVGRVVNAVPAVVAAPPGIVTTLDLPLAAGAARITTESPKG